MYKKLLILFVFVVGILFTQNVFGAPYVPPPSPAPTVSISASPTSVSYNGSSTLTWSSTNARSCTASGSWSGTKVISGSQSTGNLTSSKTYTLTCTGAGGSVARSVTINVASNPANCSCYLPLPSGCSGLSDTGTQCTGGCGVSSYGSYGTGTFYLPYCAGAVPPPPITPITVNFSANPISVNFNGSSILSWSSTGTTSCVGTNFNTSGATSNSVGVSTGALTASETYTITCSKADVCLSTWGDIPLYSTNIASGTYLGTAVQWCAGKTNQTACNNASASPGGADPVQPICKWVPGPTPVSKTVTVTVAPPASTLNLTASSYSLTIPVGQSKTSTITVTSTNISGNVTLDSFSNNTKLDTNLNPKTVSGNGSPTSNLTVGIGTATSQDCPAASPCKVTVTGSGNNGAVTDLTTISVTVTAPMSGSLSSPDCTIASGASTCSPTVTWSTTNPQSISAVTASGMTDVNGNSGSQSMVVPYPSRTFYLYNNGQLLAQDLQQASCVSGTSWDGAKCAPPLPPMSGTLTGPSSCIITLGNKDCSINLSWSITNPEGNTTAITWFGGASTVSNSKTPSFQSGTQSVTVPYSGRTFYLYNNGKELSNKPASASCGSNVWNGLFCSPPPSGTLSATSCTIAIGGTSCPSTVSWEVLNPTFFANTEVKREPPYSTISTDQSGTKTEIISYGTANFSLFHNGLLLKGPIPAKASCPANTTWNGTCAYPLPTANISASPNPIPYNTSSNISWSSTNATSCSITKAGVAWKTGISGINISSGALTTNTTFTVTCTGLGGTSAPASVTVTVNTPLVMSGTLTPGPTTSCIIASGGNSCSIALTRTVTNPVVPGGSAVTSPTGTPSPSNGDFGTVTFTAPYNVLGVNFFLYNNNILLAQTNVATNCASGTEWNSSSGKCLPIAKPISVSISASPQSMNLPANSTTLSWNTTGSPTSCTATGNWSGAKAVLGGSENKTGLTAGNYTYTITCSKSKAPDAVASVTVTVGAKLICTPPTTETRNTTSCPVGQTGTITETRTKSAYPGCAWGSWTVTSNTCTLIPVMSGTLTPSSPSCEITAGNNSCYIPFSWRVINPQNPGGSAITRNPIIAVGDSGNNVPFSVEYNYGNGRTFYLYNNGVEPPLAQSTVYSDCILGTSWNTNGSNTCVTNPLPSPTANISVNPTSTTSGGAITITWSSTNALSCTGEGFDTGGATSGSVVVYPTINTAYSVRCDGVSAYATGSASVTISSTGKKPKFKEN